jgi:hypothetical protein
MINEFMNHEMIDRLIVYSWLQDELTKELQHLTSSAVVDTQGVMGTDNAVNAYWAINGQFMQPFIQSITSTVDGTQLMSPMPCPGMH